MHNDLCKNLCSVQGFVQLARVCATCKGLCGVQWSVHAFVQRARVYAKVCAMHNELSKGLCGVQWFMQEFVQCARVCTDLCNMQGFMQGSVQCARVCARVYAVCKGLCKGLSSVQWFMQWFVQHARICARVYAVCNGLCTALCRVQGFMQGSVQRAMAVHHLRAPCSVAVAVQCCQACACPRRTWWHRAHPGSRVPTCPVGAAGRSSARTKPNQAPQQQPRVVGSTKNPSALGAVPRRVLRGHKVHQDSGPGSATEASRAVSCSVCPPQPQLLCVQLRREAARLPLRADKPPAA